MQNGFALTVLQTMYSEARRSRPPGLRRLCFALGASPADVGQALVELERSGLVTAHTARLTLPGLVVAASATAAGARRAPSRRVVAA